MTTLYVDRRGVSLKLDGEALVCQENGERVGTVPLAPLSRVYLRGEVTLTSSLLGKLGARGIGVVVLSGRRAEPTLLLGRPHNDARRRLAQYRLAQDAAFCLAQSKRIVRDKLLGQMAFLAERRDAEPRSRYLLTVTLRKMEGALSGIAEQDSVGRLRGVEGAGAAAYFDGYADLLPESLHFHRRNRRPPKDPVNAMLSLGYTLLHAEAVLAAYGAGFDPFIGFYHAVDFGRESLACDLVEPLRVEVDRHVLRLIRDGVLRAEDFSMAEGACLLGKAGRSRFYEAWEPVAERLRKALDEAVADLAEKVSPDKTAAAPAVEAF
jgi:CRISPR-associated protein Cas1